MNRDLFSSLYISYYYGSLIQCPADWGEWEVSCSYSKLYYILEGGCRIEAGGQAFHGGPGDLFLIPAGICHSFYHDAGGFLKKYWFHFDLEAGGRSLFDLVPLPYRVGAGLDSGLIAQFEQILAAAKGTGITDALALRSGILALVADYARRSGGDLSGYCKRENRLGGVLEYIYKNLNRNLTVEELAGLLCLHPNYFIRLFRNETGMPPVRYINRLRMERAKTLLESTALPLGEVMEAVGFSDASHFSKFFKSHSGYSPSRFRELSGRESGSANPK